MQDRGFKLSAVLFGVIADVAFTFGVAMVAGTALGISMVQNGTPATELETEINMLLSAEPWLAAIHVVGFTGTALGGYVAARLARHEPLKHAAVAGILSLGLGIGMSVEDFKALPEIYQAATLLLPVPVACLGGWLVHRRLEAASPSPTGVPTAAEMLDPIA